MKILIAGASGFIGRNLVRFLSENRHQVSVLTREISKKSHDIFWNPETLFIELKKLEGFDVIINLCGEDIANGRWNKEKKARIFNSRIKTTQFLAESISKLETPPKIFLCASAVGYYGYNHIDCCSEQATAGEGFLALVCQEWEKATISIAQLGIRTVNLRFGVVLASDGGMIARVLRFFWCNLGITLGKGKNLISWISIQDCLRAIVFCIQNNSIKGPINICSPLSVTNKEFYQGITQVLAVKYLLSLPAYLVRILCGDLANEVLLASNQCTPAKLIEHGFIFQDQEIQQVLHDILRAQSTITAEKRDNI